MEQPERIWAHKYPNGVVGAHDRPGGNPYYTSAEYDEYIRIPPEGSERDALVERMEGAIRERLDDDPYATLENIARAALEVLIGDKDA